MCWILLEPWTKPCPVFVGGWKHQKEFVQVTLHVGWSFPTEEVVRAGRQGQLCGPGLANQAAAADRQRQHPRQPKVFKAGVYDVSVLYLNVYTQSCLFDIFALEYLNLRYLFP